MPDRFGAHLHEISAENIAISSDRDAADRVALTHEIIRRDRRTTDGDILAAERCTIAPPEQAGPAAAGRSRAASHEAGDGVDVGIPQPQPQVHADHALMTSARRPTLGNSTGVRAATGVREAARIDFDRAPA